MFLWYCLLSFAVASHPSPAEQQAIVRTSRFLEAVNTLDQAKGSVESVKSAVDIVQETIKDILTVATSKLPDTQEMRRAQRLSRQIMNVIFMILFEDNPAAVEELIMLLVENKTSPILAEKLSSIDPVNAHKKIRELLHDEKLGGIFQGQITNFYTVFYGMESTFLKATQSHFNRNVAIGAFALTFAGVVASIALGATIIGLPAALGLLVSTVGGPGFMAVQSWNKHKTEELIGKAAPTMGSSFKEILITVERLKTQIEELEKRINTSCPNPVGQIPPGKLERVKQFFRS